MSVAVKLFVFAMPQVVRFVMRYLASVINGLENAPDKFKNNTTFCDSRSQLAHAPINAFQDVSREPRETVAFFE